MKITLYELLGLIKEGKEPKEIKFGNIKLKYDEANEDYINYYGNGLFEYKFGNCKNFLNDEAEIIEEPKKIEKLNPEPISRRQYLCDESTIDFLKADIINIISKVNELIDEINNLKEND